MDIDPRDGIVRILSPDGSTAGAGFIVSDDGLVVTCAHAIQAPNGGQPQSVTLVLHASGDTLQATVEADGWRPADAEDIALLRLTADLAQRAKALQIARSNHSKGHRFEAFGFPSLNPEEGLWGRGEILGDTTIGGVRVLQLRCPEATSGFSGTPVWDHDFRRVVGMVASIATPDEHGRLSAVAFATPIEVLVETWPEWLEALLRESEEELVHEVTRLEEQAEQLYLIAVRGARQLRPIEILRRATKLFVGDWAVACTGKPRKQLRQRCLTEASKLPCSEYLDMQLLVQTADHLGRLDREMRILLDAWRIEPLPGLWDAL